MSQHLYHKTIFHIHDSNYNNNYKNNILKLPFIDKLREYHPEGSFDLLVDPRVTHEAAIIGMFVLRPAYENFIGDLIEESKVENLKKTVSSLLYNSKLDWSYGLKDIPGGWIIANRSTVDAYR